MHCVWMYVIALHLHMFVSWTLSGHKVESPEEQMRDAVEAAKQVKEN